MDKDLLEFLQAFREETTKRFDEMEERFTGQVSEMEQRSNRRFDEMGRRLDVRIDTLQEETTQRLDTLGAETRAAHILIEDLRGKVQIVAEGVAGGTEQLQQHREEMSQRFDTLESFFRRSYRALSSRVRKLEAI